MSNIDKYTPKPDTNVAKIWLIQK